MKPKRTLPRKRLRGLRRHARRHRARAAQAELLDSTYLAGYGAYHQLGLAPWTVHGRPPAALRQLWASRLLTDFYSWCSQLLVSHSDFYLAVWLYEPRFGKSQLVAEVGERAAHYRDLFGEPAEHVLPPEYQGLPGAAALRWTTYPELDALDPEEFAEHRAWYAHKPHWPGTTQHSEPCVVGQTN